MWCCQSGTNVGSNIKVSYPSIVYDDKGGVVLELRGSIEPKTATLTPGKEKNVVLEFFLKHDTVHAHH